MSRRALSMPPRRAAGQVVLLTTLAVTHQILWWLVLCALTFAACSIKGQPCGLLNVSNCPAGAQTQTCPVLVNVTGAVTVWQCNIPGQYCNGAPGQNDGPLAGCGCVICQTSEQAALEEARQILAMQSVSVDPGGPPLQCRGPVATLSAAYDTGPLFTVGECSRVTQATCKPCDDGQGGTLQSVGQHCGVDQGTGNATCCAGLSCLDVQTGQPLQPGGEMGVCTGTLAPCATADAGSSAACSMLGQVCNNSADVAQEHTCCPGVVCSADENTEDAVGTCCALPSSAAAGVRCGANTDCCQAAVGMARCVEGACCYDVGAQCSLAADECCSGLSCQDSTGGGDYTCEP